MSYIAVKSEELRKLAEQTIASIDGERSERWDMLVDSEWANAIARTKTWLGRLLRRKPPSREDVEASLKLGDHYGYSQHDFIFSSCGEQRKRATRLLNACRGADVVHVSADDYWWVT